MKFVFIFKFIVLVRLILADDNEENVDYEETLTTESDTREEFKCKPSYNLSPIPNHMFLRGEWHHLYYWNTNMLSLNQINACLSMKFTVATEAEKQEKRDKCPNTTFDWDNAELKSVSTVNSKLSTLITVEQDKESFLTVLCDVGRIHFNYVADNYMVVYQGQILSDKQIYRSPISPPLALFGRYKPPKSEIDCIVKNLKLPPSMVGKHTPCKNLTDIWDIDYDEK